MPRLHRDATAWQRSVDLKLQQIINHLYRIEFKENVMAQELDNLTKQVQQDTDVESSAITLLQGLSQQISSLKQDPQAIQRLADKLQQSSAQLASAITANTPAAAPTAAPATDPGTGAGTGV